MRHSDRAAVVIAGAGVSGLLAASALRHLGPVRLIEPDAADAWASDVRHGVPHGDQLHNLLGRAQRHLEELVPGILADVEAGGGVSGSVSDQTHVVEYGVAIPPRELGMAIWSVTRRSLEEALAERVLGRGVERSTGRVVGLDADPDGVTAAVVEDDTGRHCVRTGLVVDATGRRAAGRGWLAELGLAVPESLTLSTREWYASTVVPVPTPAAPFVLVFPTGDTPYGGLVSPAGPHASRVSLNGSVGSPPRTMEAFVETARSLADPSVSAVLEAGLDGADTRPAIRSFGAPRASWHRFDEQPDPLPGFLPVGDAVASLSPLFGQGISGAAWEASGLRSAFGSPAAADDDRGRRLSTRAYLAHSGRVRRAQWDLMTIQAPSGPGDLDAAQIETLMERVTTDPTAHAAYVRMWHLLAPAEVLPALVAGDPVDRYVSVDEDVA